jgi:hypothetical protein
MVSYYVLIAWYNLVLLTLKLTESNNIIQSANKRYIREKVHTNHSYKVNQFKLLYFIFI